MTIEQSRLEQLFSEAAASARRRSHLLLHSGPDDQVQRLLIAAQPGTYVRPHKHSEQWELLSLLHGRARLFLLDDRKVIQCCALNAGSPVAQIKRGEWHACFIDELDTLLLEVKPGPYRPNEFATWAPEEGTPEAADFLSRMGKANVGSVLRYE